MVEPFKRITVVTGCSVELPVRLIVTLPGKLFSCETVSPVPMLRISLADGAWLGSQLLAVLSNPSPPPPSQSSVAACDIAVIASSATAINSTNVDLFIGTSLAYFRI